MRASEVFRHDSAPPEWVVPESFRAKLLAQYGEHVFVCPPYDSHVGRAVAEAYEVCRAQRRLVLVLTYAATDTRWWHRWAGKAREVRFLAGRMRYRMADGHVREAIRSSALLVFEWSWMGFRPRMGEPLAAPEEAGESVEQPEEATQMGLFE